MEDQLSKTQEDLHITKVSLEKCRAEADSLRAENSVLSRFVDQLTEEIESCQSEILNCRDALKDASQRSAQSQAEFHELHGRTDILRVSDLRCLETHTCEQLGPVDMYFGPVSDSLGDVFFSFSLTFFLS
jgi:vacuolar-type H+-ATPase subunit D/Vma8